MIELVADVIREKQAEIVGCEAEVAEWKHETEQSKKAAVAYRRKATIEEQRRKGWQTATFVTALVTAVAGVVVGILIPVSVER